jgi:5-carboxymethyl-2-hydroxymuconate isomerase
VPHLTLEYTDNLYQSAGPIPFAKLFAELHQLLVRIAGVDINNCKSRAIRHGTHVVGDGREEIGFVHLEIRLFAGRSSPAKTALGREGLDILERYFPAPAEGPGPQITIQISEIRRDAYFKA